MENNLEKVNFTKLTQSIMKVIRKHAPNGSELEKDSIRNNRTYRTRTRESRQDSFRCLRTCFKTVILKPSGLPEGFLNNTSKAN